MKKNITLQDIANMAGVSRATVSYVLTGKKRVSKEVTERVISIAEKEGYVHKKSMKSNRERNKGAAIGFVVLPNWVQPKEDFFVFATLEGIYSQAKKGGFSLIYNRINRFDGLEERLVTEIHETMEGVVVLNPGDDALYDNFMNNLKKHNIPHVLIGTPNDEETYYIDVDVISAAYQSTSLLLSKGCKHIMCIDNPKGMKQSTQILRGCRLAFEERDLQWDEKRRMLSKNTSIEEGERIVESIISSGIKVDGFVTPNDILARGIIIALRRFQKRIPEEVKIVSLGGGVISNQISHPRISAVDYNPYQMGQEAANMLIEIINKKRMRPTHSVFPAILIERETS